MACIIASKFWISKLNYDSYIRVVKEISILVMHVHFLNL